MGHVGIGHEKRNTEVESMNRIRDTFQENTKFRALLISILAVNSIPV